MKGRRSVEVMNTYKIGTKFNDVLTKDIIKTWKKENVILNGATGSGKTYFIEHNLYTYAENNFKSILFLCNRTELFKQVLLEKERYGLYVMEVMLYQTLQKKIIEHEEIKHYDFIVCDEFHYVLTDAMFNIYTDLTYDWILSREESIKIFMSGTGKTIFNKLKKENIVKEQFEYYIPYDYSYADLRLFNKKKNIFDIINNIIESTDDKIIYFANSIDTALRVYKQFKEYSILRCSREVKNDEAKELNTMDCIKTYSRDLITFDNRLLITTKCLDNGVNIRDRKLKHIISDVFDLDSAQQCLGRKRVIDAEDKCAFYIMNYKKKAIGNFKGGLNKNYNPLKLFIKDRKEFEQKYDANRKYHNNFIYFNEGERKYNKLAFSKMVSESIDIELMEKLGYCCLFLSRLGETIGNVDDMNVIEEYKMKDELELYLNDIKNKKLDKDAQKELIDKIDLRDKRNRQQKSIGQINTYLMENYNKTLNSKVTRENGKRNTRWIISDLR